jgi:hypothetical protein
VAGALADAVAVEAVPVDAPSAGGAYRRASAEELARLAPACRRALQALAEGYREAAPPELADADLRAGLELLPARLLNIAFLHAAWNADLDLSAALTLAGVAAGLVERPIAPGLALS